MRFVYFWNDGLEVSFAVLLFFNHSERNALNVGRSFTDHHLFLPSVCLPTGEDEWSGQHVQPGHHANHRWSHGGL